MGKMGAGVICGKTFIPGSFRLEARREEDHEKILQQLTVETVPGLAKFGQQIYCIKTKQKIENLLNYRRVFENETRKIKETVLLVKKKIVNLLFQEDTVVGVPGTHLTTITTRV
jgi:hypothetical protein